MKVVAKISDNLVLCEVSREEIAFLNGFRSVYEKDCHINKLMDVGAECNLQKMVHTSQFVRGLRTDLLKRTKGDLEQSIAQIDSAIEVVSGLEIFNILSENEQVG
jgi:hypothetical protein